MEQISISQLSDLLLTWYDRVRRDLPWRQNKDPYRIWLSEIMLQQTQVATVIPYFNAFLQKWSTLQDLAAAEDDQVLKAWEGLGYYSRARNLLAAVRICCEKHACTIPESEKDRLALPGVGEYTAAAIGAIAFGHPVVAVDGNLVRVFARLTATAWNPADLPQRREVRRLAESLLPLDRSGDFNEALMDLGATVCTPRQPLCGDCPLNSLCQAKAMGQVSKYPAKPDLKPRPVEYKAVVILMCGDKIHVSKRPPRGLLANLYEFDWLELPAGEAKKTIQERYPGALIESLGQVIHDFTHKRWVLEGYRVELAKRPDINNGNWHNIDELEQLAFPVALNTLLDKIKDRQSNRSEL